ncbi:MAG: TonB-dependent receptor [Gammaproteobacteria bacterium]
MIYRVWTSRLLPVLLLLLLTAMACADETAPIVVTASRIAESADNTLFSVTIIKREEIERSQSASIADLLRGKAGIDVTNQGGQGQLTSLFLRGTNTSHVTVLVDGIRMGSVTAGGVSWEFIPLAQVDRIEIVRGPNSALYGSEAIGGVVQIFTKRGKGDMQWGISAGAGRYNTREAALDFSGSSNGNWFAGHLTRLDTDGFNAREPTVVFGTPLNEPDDDGFNNTSISFRAGHRFSNNTEIEFHGLHSEGSLEFDNTATSPDEEDFVEQAAGITLRISPADNLGITAAAGRSLDKRKTFRATLPGSRVFFDSERRTFSLQGDYYRTDTDVFTLGFDSHDDLVDSSTGYNETSRYTNAVFAQYRGEIGKHTFLGRIRPLDDEQFGSHTTGNIAWGYPVSNHMQLTASYGTAYRAPTFNDLYFPSFMGFPTSDPNLDPETSNTLELGLQGKTGELEWDIRAFRTDIDDLIIFDLATFLPANIGKARIDGLEVSISGTLFGWMTDTSITLLDPRDEITDKVLPRRAKRSFNLAVDRQFGTAGIGAIFRAQSSRYDDSGNTVKAGGYGILDLHATWSPVKNWGIRGHINNVLDKKYQTVDTYNSERRSLFVSVNYRSNG